MRAAAAAATMATRLLIATTLAGVVAAAEAEARPAPAAAAAAEAEAEARPYIGQLTQPCPPVIDPRAFPFPAMSLE